MNRGFKLVEEKWHAEATNRIHINVVNSILQDYQNISDIVRSHDSELRTSFEKYRNKVKKHEIPVFELLSKILEFHKENRRSLNSQAKNQKKVLRKLDFSSSDCLPKRKGLFTSR